MQDEELEGATVLALALEAVSLEMRQRPAANNFLLDITMQRLTVTGIQLNRYFAHYNCAPWSAPYSAHWLRTLLLGILHLCSLLRSLAPCTVHLRSCC